MNSNSIRIALAVLAVSFAMWQHEAAQAASSRACDAFARDYARNASRQGQVVRRGVFGGLLGLGVGAATGGAAAGAASPWPAVAGTLTPDAGVPSSARSSG